MEGSSVIGCVEVRVDTGEPGQIKGLVKIHLAEEQRSPDQIEVIGTVEPAAKIHPEVLFLPRQSSEGLVLSGSCACKSRRGEPIVVSIAKVPPGLTVQVEEGPAGGTAVVRVTVDPAANPEASSMAGREIHLRARVAGQDIPLALTVISP
jgi:hypothetical protein